MLLSAPVLLPALQLAGNSARAGWSYTQAAGYSLSPAQWIGWLIPGFFGRGPQFHWGAWPRVEVGYIGILTLILAGLALALRRERRTWAWAGLAGISFVLALGIYAIPHGWLTLLPGFGQLRAPARFVLLADFALAALAALGLDAACSRWSGPAALRSRRCGGGSRCGRRRPGDRRAVGLPGAAVDPGSRPRYRLRVSITLIAVVSFAGLLLASLLWLTARRGNWARASTLGWLAAGLILLDLASLGAYQDLSDQEPEPELRAAGHRQLPGRATWAVPDRQPDPDREPVAARHRAAVRLRGRGRHRQPAGAGRNDPLLGEHGVALQPALRSAQHPLRDRQERRDAGLGQVRAGLRRRSQAQRLREPPRPATHIRREAGSAGREPRCRLAGHPHAGFRPRADGHGGGLASTSALTSTGRGEVTEIRAGPNRLTLKVNVDGPALLVVSQAWYPGWQAVVDGRAQGSPLRTDYAFQGVALEAGSHTVELRFAPPLWRLGWVLAGATLAVLLVGVLVGARHRRRS